jgi:nicotinamidase-related amidase
MSDWKMHGKPALLILHMRPALKEVEAEALKKTGIIPRQQALLKAFRSKKLPVIYVNDKPFPLNGDLHFPVYGNLWERFAKTEFISHEKMTEVMPELAPEPFTSSEEMTKVMPELAPQPGEPVLLSWPFDPFNESGLDQALKLYGVQTLVMVGFASYGGVYGALQVAADLYYSIIIPKDASAGPSDEANQAFMETIAPMNALVTTTDDVIAHLKFKNI